MTVMMHGHGAGVTRPSTFGHSAMTLNDLGTAGPSFDDQLSCLQLMVMRTTLFDPGKRLTRVPQ